VGLLLILSWIVGLTAPMFTVIGEEISGRDLILIAGGLFLVWKSTKEIHQLTEGEEGHASARVKASFGAIIVQIILIDMVFSLDSIITAVGMVDEVSVMIAAVIASVGLMMLFAKAIGDFVSAHPSIKMLALSFLLVVGVMLVAEGFEHKVPKGYIYFAMAFSVAVEMLNIRSRKKARAPDPVHLHEPYEKSESATRRRREAAMVFAIVRLIGVIWIFGFIVLALAATSGHLYSAESQPERSQRWLSRLRMALIWPIALLSPAGRSRLRRG
jgi:predicted tellurium resistance membrane protein TerC